MQPDDQLAILDVIIFTSSMALVWPVMSITESRRARRKERKLWNQYISLSMSDTPFISWEQFRKENTPNHG